MADKETNLEGQSRQEAQPELCYDRACKYREVMHMAHPTPTLDGSEDLRRELLRLKTEDGYAISAVAAPSGLHAIVNYIQSNYIPRSQALTKQAVEEAITMLEPDNYDDWYAEGWNGAMHYIRSRLNLPAIDTEGKQ